MAIGKIATAKAEKLGRDGATPHDAYDVAESLFGSGTRPENADKRREFCDVYRAAFAAAGYVWRTIDSNARRNASGVVERAPERKP